MIIEKIDDKRAQLALSLQKYTNSYRRNNISFIINAHTEYVADITIVVTGLRGTVQKDIVIVYIESTQEWTAYCMGYRYTLLALSDISIIIKSLIQKLSVTLTKI